MLAQHSLRSRRLLLAPEEGGGLSPLSYSRPVPRPGVLGRGIAVVGDVIAGEDLIIAGRFEGNIDLPDHALTIAQDARAGGQLFARTITIAGRVAGSVTASEWIEVLETATVDGDLTAPKVAIELGASFQGRVEMTRAEAAVRVARYRIERKSQAPPEAP